MCYTNGIDENGDIIQGKESVAMAVANSMQEHMEKAPEYKRYFMFGRQDDGLAICDCEKCKKGYGANPEGNKCVICQPGYYGPGDGMGCLPCPKGSVSSTTASESCTKCSKGYGPNSDRSMCLRCSSGQYSKCDGFGCEDCGIGSISEEGAEECTKCLAGKGRNSKGNECIEYVLFKHGLHPLPSDGE